MARNATDTDFNSASRQLLVEIAIYFNGLSAEPLIVTTNDYLIDADWLEEGSADSTNPYGEISANELSFRLFNNNGMFSPTYSAGPYYGKIKTDVPIKISIKPENDVEEINWEELGTYYVTNWDAQITGIYADVTAADQWHAILSTPLPIIKTGIGYTYKSFLSTVFTAMGFSVDISDSLLSDLPFAFIGTDTDKFLQEFISANIGYATCKKNGAPYIGAYDDETVVRATLTDADQIKTIKSKQTIIKTYNGVELTYSLPQVSKVVSLVELNDLLIPTGTTEINNIALTNGPLWQINAIQCISPMDGIDIVSCVADPWKVSLTVHNTGDLASVSIIVYGTIIDLTDIVISDSTTRMLQLSNKYIQTQEYAEEYNTALTAYVSSNMPTLELDIRGNCLLNVGNRVVVQSDKYNIYFSGIIQRLKYTYTGALSCTMTLLNTSVL